MAQLFTWGAAAHGQLGHAAAATVDRACPALVTALRSEAVAVACGGAATFVADSRGAVWAMGQGFGQTPQLVAGLGKRRVVALAAGAVHALALDSGGRAWLWGGSAGQPQHPVALALPTGGIRVTHIAAGGAFSMLRTEDGSLWAVGANPRGQLGLGDTADRETPQRVAGLPGTVAQVACGGQHTLVVTADSVALATGGNKFGQLGVGDKTDRTTFTPLLLPADTAVITCIACGDNHSLLATAYGHVFGAGRKVQCGASQDADCTVPTLISVLTDKLRNTGDAVMAMSASGAFGKAHSAIITNSGRCLCWGSNEHGQCAAVGMTDLPVPEPVQAFAGRRVVAASCGWMHTAAILAAAPRPFAAASFAEVCSPLGMFNRVGADVALYVLSFLDSPHDLAAVARVNHTFHAITSHNELWRSLFEAKGFTWGRTEQQWETVALAKKNSPIAKLAQSWAAAGSISDGIPIWKLRFAHCCRTGSRFFFRCAFCSLSSHYPLIITRNDGVQT